jgi:hypothetical protein
MSVNFDSKGNGLFLHTFLLTDIQQIILQLSLHILLLIMSTSNEYQLMYLKDTNNEVIDFS